jgi:guanylate kinase
MKKFKSRMIAFSAPSGAGKTSLIKSLVARHKELVISISATTRKKRLKEIEGIDYIFVTQDKFQEEIEKGSFLEYEKVHGEYYGTLRKTVENFLKEKKIVLFDIDVNGALNIKAAYPETLLIFIKAPTEDELIRRLKGRNSEETVIIKKRLERLPFEYDQSQKFDYVIINHNFYETVNKIDELIIEY